MPFFRLNLLLSLICSAWVAILSGLLKSLQDLTQALSSLLTQLLVCFVSGNLIVLLSLKK